jgi:hypothetical protein
VKKINIHPLTKPNPEVPADGKTVYISTSENCVHSTQEDVKWGRWEKVYQCSVEYITKNKPNSWHFEAKVVPPEVYNAERVYLVCIFYSSGDSFGNSKGNLDVYKVLSNKEEAIALAKKIQEEGKDFQHPKDEFPQWCGYFEKVERVELLESEYT